MAALCELSNNVADGGWCVQSRGSHAGGPRPQVRLGGRILSECRVSRRPSPSIGRTREERCRKEMVTKPGLAESGGARFSGVSLRENCEGRSKQNDPPRQAGRQMNQRRVVDSRAIWGSFQAAQHDQRSQGQERIPACTSSTSVSAWQPALEPIAMTCSTSRRDAHSPSKFNPRRSARRG